MTKEHTPDARRDGENAPLRVGLVNSMPDGALASTERQFRSLLQAASPDREIELVLFELPGINRVAAVRARMADRYQSSDAITDAGLDAMVVTGAKPGDGPLRNSPIWPGFARLIDLAVELRLPTLWSCLAAHAAVDHLDNIKRRPLAAPYSGVFASAPVWSDPLLEGIDQVWSLPHSRMNELAEGDLVARGYDILMRAPSVGVDVFVKRGPPLFLFCQGHPEYDQNTLTIEYKRDLLAFIRGQRPAPPAIPSGLFDAQTEAAWADCARAAIALGTIDLKSGWPEGAGSATGFPDWRNFTVGLYRNWLRSAVQETSHVLRSSVTTDEFSPQRP